MWALATGLVAAVYGGFYPQITDDAAANVPEALRGFGFDDQTSAAGYLQGAVFGLLATALGAATGKGRATVFGLTAGTGVLAYVANGLAPQTGGDWLRHLTPFHYYIGGQPLKNGFPAVDLLVLAAATATVLTAGAWRFSQRELGR